MPTDRVPSPLPADAALGVQHEPLVEPIGSGSAKTSQLQDEIACGCWPLPVYSGRFRRSRLDLRAVAVVELDRRRQPIAREHRLAPDEERAIGDCGGAEQSDALTSPGSAGERVDLGSRLVSRSRSHRSGSAPRPHNW